MASVPLWCARAPSREWRMPNLRVMERAGLLDRARCGWAVLSYRSAAGEALTA